MTTEKQTCMITSIRRNGNKFDVNIDIWFSGDIKWTKKQSCMINDFINSDNDFIEFNEKIQI